MGNFTVFPVRLMGTLGYRSPVWLDWSGAPSRSDLRQKPPLSGPRPRYDRADSALADALEDHALVLIPPTTWCTSPLV